MPKIPRGVLDLLSSAIGIMAGRESRSMIRSRGGGGGVDGIDLALERVSMYCLAAQVHDNLTVRLVQGLLELVREGQLKTNITMMGTAVWPSQQLVVTGIYDLPDNPIPVRDVVYDFGEVDRDVLLNRFVERNDLLSKLSPFIGPLWQGLDSIALPLTLMQQHIGKTRRITPLPDDPEPSFFNHVVCTGWSTVDPSTRAGVITLSELAAHVRKQALSTPERDGFVRPAEEPIMHAQDRVIILTDGAGASMLHSGIDDEPKTLLSAARDGEKPTVISVFGGLHSQMEHMTKANRQAQHTFLSVFMRKWRPTSGRLEYFLGASGYYTSLFESNYFLAAVHMVAFRICSRILHPVPATALDVDAMLTTLARHRPLAEKILTYVRDYEGVNCEADGERINNHELSRVGQRQGLAVYVTTNAHHYTPMVVEQDVRLLSCGERFRETNATFLHAVEVGNNTYAAWDRVCEKAMVQSGRRQIGDILNEAAVSKLNATATQFWRLHNDETSSRRQTVRRAKSQKRDVHGAISGVAPSCVPQSAMVAEMCSRLEEMGVLDPERSYMRILNADGSFKEVDASAAVFLDGEPESQGSIDLDQTRANRVAAVLDCMQINHRQESFDAQGNKHPVRTGPAVKEATAKELKLLAFPPAERAFHSERLCTVTALQALCKLHGIKKSGTKPEIVERLVSKNIGVPEELIQGTQDHARRRRPRSLLVAGLVRTVVMSAKRVARLALHNWQKKWEVEVERLSNDQFETQAIMDVQTAEKELKSLKGKAGKKSVEAGERKP